MLPSLKNRTSRLLDPLELRATPRVATDIPVDLYSTDISGSLPGRARDISIEGISVATPSPFAIKSIQRVVLAFSEGPISIDAAGSWQSDSDNEDGITGDDSAWGPGGKRKKGKGGKKKAGAGRGKKKGKKGSDSD